MGVSPPIVYGPFFTSNELGTSGQFLLDVAITPDERYALVSNFYGQTVYRIDISDPTNPTLAGSVNIGFDAEDIAIAPNGQFAVVVDGGNENQIAFINLSSFSLNGVYTLTTSSGEAQAIAIVPDNQTIIICDTDSNRIIYGQVNPTINGLISESTLPTGSDPVNVTISPDGNTALVANGADTTVSVFQITGVGAVAAGVPPTVGVLPGDQQSIAFSPSGGIAFVVSTSSSPDQLSWLQVNAPGNVTLGGAGVANLLSDTSGYLFGVDTIATAPGIPFAIVGNPYFPGTPTTNVVWYIPEHLLLPQLTREVISLLV
jgi:DNA-binding beta-propeller fold protein YncE